MLRGVMGWLLSRDAAVAALGFVLSLAGALGSAFYLEPAQKSEDAASQQIVLQGARARMLRAVSSSCANSGPRKAIFLRDELGRSAGLGDLAPSRKGSLARSAAEVGRGGFGIRDVEEVRDLIMNHQEPLRLSS